MERERREISTIVEKVTIATADLSENQFDFIFGPITAAKKISEIVDHQLGRSFRIERVEGFFQLLTIFVDRIPVFMDGSEEIRIGQLIDRLFKGQDEGMILLMDSRETHDRCLDESAYCSSMLSLSRPCL